MNVPESELLSAYLDGEVTAAEQARAEELLAADAEARRFVDGLRALRARLQELPAEKLDEDLSARVLRAAEDRIRADDSRPSPAQRPWWREHSWRGMLSRRALVWSGLAVAIAVMFALNESPQPKPHAGRDAARAPAPAARPPAAEDLARAPEAARRWDEPPGLWPVGPSEGAAASGPHHAVAKPSARAREAAKAEEKAPALGNKLAKSEQEPSAPTDKAAKAEEKLPALTGGVADARARPSVLAGKVAESEAKSLPPADRVAGSKEKRSVLAEEEEAAKFRSDGRPAEVASTGVKKAEAAASHGTGDKDRRLLERVDKPAAANLALGSNISDGAKGRGAAANGLQEATKPGAGPRPPAAPPATASPRPDTGDAVAGMSTTPHGAAEAGTDLKVAGPASGPPELPPAAPAGARAPSAAPRPLAMAKQQAAVGRTPTAAVPGGMGGGIGGLVPFGRAQPAKRLEVAPPQSMIVECQVGPEAVRTRAFESLLTRNGLGFRHGPSPKQFPQASAVYEVDATPAQVGLVLAQIAQNKATFHSFTVQPSSAAADRGAADLDALRQSAGAAKSAGASGGLHRGKAGPARPMAESSKGSNHASDDAPRPAPSQEETIRHERTAGEQPAAPPAEGQAVAGGQGGGAGAMPGEPQQERFRERSVESRRALGDREQDAAKDQAPAVAKGMRRLGGDESGKGGGGQPAAAAYRVVFILRVDDSIPAAAAAPPPPKAKPPAP